MGITYFRLRHHRDPRQRDGASAPFKRFAEGKTLPQGEFTSPEEEKIRGPRETGGLPGSFRAPRACWTGKRREKAEQGREGSRAEGAYKRFDGVKTLPQGEFTSPEEIKIWGPRETGGLPGSFRAPRACWTGKRRQKA